MCVCVMYLCEGVCECVCLHVCGSGVSIHTYTRTYIHTQTLNMHAYVHAYKCTVLCSANFHCSFPHRLAPWPVRAGTRWSWWSPISGASAARSRLAADMLWAWPSTYAPHPHPCPQVLLNLGMVQNVHLYCGVFFQVRRSTGVLASVKKKYRKLILAAGGRYDRLVSGSGGGTTGW